MTHYAYSHRLGGDYQGEFPTADAAAAAGVQALEDFLDGKKPAEFYVTKIETFSLAAYLPPLEQFIADLAERVTESAGDAGDEAVSWLDENVGGFKNPEISADLQKNLAGVVRWWADKHSAPAVLEPIEGAMIAVITRQGEYRWRSGPDDE